MPGTTVDATRSEVNQKDQAKQKKTPQRRLRGIPRGLICRSKDLRAEMGIGYPAWQKLREAGLDARYLPGSDTEFVSTDSLHDLFNAAPKYQKKPK